MHIYLGSDHGGFSLKAQLISDLQIEGVLITDCGTSSLAATDYPDYALAVAKKVAEEGGSFGILLCRSGEGMEMAANKVNGVRAALVWEEEVAMETRRDNDANILVLPADFISRPLALACVRRFLVTSFSNLPRHIQRLDKLNDIEKLQNA